MEHNSSLLNCRLCIMNSFRRVQYWKRGGKSNFTGEKINRQLTSARWSRWISTVVNHVQSMYPWYDVIRKAIYLYDLLPQSPQPQSTHEKNTIKIPVEEHSTKYLMSSLKLSRSSQKQLKSEKPTQPWWLKHNVVLWIGSWKRKGMFKKKIWMKYRP